MVCRCAALGHLHFIGLVFRAGAGPRWFTPIPWISPPAITSVHILTAEWYLPLRCASEGSPSGPNHSRIITAPITTAYKNFWAAAFNGTVKKVNPEKVGHDFQQGPAQKYVVLPSKKHHDGMCTLWTRLPNSFHSRRIAAASRAVVRGRKLRPRLWLRHDLRMGLIYSRCYEWTFSSGRIRKSQAIAAVKTAKIPAYGDYTSTRRWAESSPR